MYRCLRYMRIETGASVCLAFLLTLQAQSPDSESVKFSVRTKGDQTIFHIGELIPLECSFTSASENHYQINTASYDRSGRLGVESYQVEPNTGWDDPLALYFQSYGGMIGGGLSGFQKLSEQPAVIHRALNEWVRFNQPGRYHVVVTSSRVSRVGAEFLSKPKEVPSDGLWLTIIPATPEWQAAALAEALSHDKNATQAIATLRYLGTPVAAGEMARRLNDQTGAYEYKLGLASTPAREAALKSLDELLNDPDFPVNGLFLDTMSLVALPAEETPNRPAEREALEAKFRRQLIDALSRKRGAALALSAYTIIDEAAMRGHDLPQDQKQRLTAELVSGFDSLPAQMQTELFQSRWRVLDQKAMLALFPKMADRSSDQMNGSALVRWWELDPQAARPAILHEIERPHPRFSAAILGMLPDKELPEAEQQLVDHLTQDKGSAEQLASLISRYATPSVAPMVAGYLDDRLGKCACAVQAPLLAYLFRVDPQGTATRVEKAIAARGPGFTACNHSLFTDVAELHNDSALESLAARSLDDGDPQVVTNAATYLGNYASAAAEETLWTHMTEWSQHWKGREGDLQTSMYEGSPGSAMISALAGGQGWLANETKLNRLLELSIGQNQRNQAEQLLKMWQLRPLQIQFMNSGRERFQIAQYSPQSRQLAIEKLNQFPRGTTFRWLGSIAWEGEDKAFEEVSKAVASHGINIVRQVAGVQ